jgi:uridine kinase
VLRPLEPGGDVRHLPDAFGYRADRAATAWPAASRPVLLLDGGVPTAARNARRLGPVDLLVDEDVRLSRALIHDLALFGSAEVIDERYRHRYLPGQRLYRQDARPTQRDDIVLP